MTNRDIERLCKRHMAKLLTECRSQEDGLHNDVEQSILKAFSFLMNDLKQLSELNRNTDNVEIPVD